MGDEGAQQQSNSTQSPDAQRQDHQHSNSTNNQNDTHKKNDNGSSGNNYQQLIFPPGDVKHFVGGFHSDVTEENLRAHFSKFGSVADVKIMRDLVTGHSRGFGFVTMAEPSSKSRIFEEKEHVICGKKVSVRPYSEADSKDSFTDGPILKRKIFVGGVNPALGHDVLENYFGKYGPLEDATIMRYPDGRSRGFGFVVFRDESACQQVLQQRNHFVTHRDKVEVKPCLSRGKSRTMGNMMPEPYYRYNNGTGDMGPMHQYHPGSSGYGYGGSSSGYYNPSCSMYSPYGRGSSGGYDGYGVSSSHSSGWGGGDYRDWWGPYDSYSSYYGCGGWHGGGYGMSPGQPYGGGPGTVPRSTGNMKRSFDSHVYTSGSGAGSSVSPLAGSGHHGYGPLRRGGGMPPGGGTGVNYSVPRGRGSNY